ncbi:MAG: hypothetical protein Kow0059_21890 [Candidatus Sumerlaeia bacterium]
MQAVILAAGRGTRMRPLTNSTPKPLLPLGGAPMIDWIVEGLRCAGVNDIVVVTGYLGDQIERHFREQPPAGVSVRCVDQGNPDGTGRALDICAPWIAGRPFFMTFGDIIVPHDSYERLRQLYQSQRADVLLAVNRVDDPCAGAAVYMESEPREDAAVSVRAIIEKPPAGSSRTNWNNAGIFILPPEIFRFTRTLRPSRRGEFELTDALAAMIAAGYDVRAWPIQGFWSDVGNPAALDAMNALISSYYSQNQRTSTS